MRKRKQNKTQATAPRKGGSALIETIAGIFILLPVFLLLVDVIALVIAQSVNDDLAKQAARYAAQVPQYNANGSINTPAVMQNEALAAASTYLADQTTYTAVSGMICQATVQTCTFDPVNGVQVITQIRCNLPIPVPFGGPSYTMFQAQFTMPAVDVQP